MSGELRELYLGCRTYRRFTQKPIPADILQDLVESASRRSSAMNAQVLRYIVVSSPEMLKKIQPCFNWAAKLPKEIGTPNEDEQPTAFVIILKPQKSNPFADIDAGIALDTMAVSAWEQGVGSCMLANINRERLAEIITVPENYEIRMALALGYPAHSSTLVKPGADGSLGYYVDEQRDYFVPKLAPEDVISYL